MCGGKKGDAYSNPATPAQLTIVYDGEGITHIGFHLKLGDDQMIYDPNGSYAKKYNTADRGADVIEGKNASLSKYVGFQYGKGSNVNVFTFNLSTSDANAIFTAAGAMPNAGGPTCAVSCASVLRSAPTFSSIPRSSAILPWTLQNSLKNLQSGGR